jgi:hypothetical protein
VIQLRIGISVVSRKDSSGKRQKAPLTSRFMPNISLQTPDEICSELGARARARRLSLDIALEELTAISDMQPVLAGVPRSIAEMRQQAQSRHRQRTKRKSKVPKV